MLIIGAFLDLPAAVLLLGPIFVTIGEAIGLGPVQLGLMMVINLSIGLYTPPVGTTLFISAAIVRAGIGEVCRSHLLFYAVAIGVLLLISYAPSLTIYRDAPNSHTALIRPESSSSLNAHSTLARCCCASRSSSLQALSIQSTKFRTMRRLSCRHHMFAQALSPRHAPVACILRSERTVSRRVSL